jgi:NTP pyrophosphatase (non-canonical NTP hydrolase)
MSYLGITLEEAQRAAIAQNKRRFPDDEKLDIVERLSKKGLKLGEETGEVLEAILKGSTQGELAREAMDVIIVALDIIELCRQNVETIFDQVYEKNERKIKEEQNA